MNVRTRGNIYYETQTQNELLHIKRCLRASFFVFAYCYFQILYRSEYIFSTYLPKQHVNTWFVRTPVRVLLLFAEFCQILRSIATANTVINRLSCFVYICYIIILGATFTKETSEQTLGEGQKVHSVVP